MLVLSASPDRMADLLPGSPSVGKHSQEPSRRDLALWRTLCDTSELVVGEVGDVAPTGFWRRLCIVDDAAHSQFDALHAAIGSGLDLEGPTACLAIRGRNFHGQRGRSWQWAPGNLFLSVALPFHAPATEIVPALVALPAVAVVDAIRIASQRQLAPCIKWVNDILIDGRKIGGVLAASHCRRDQLEWAVLGIGVNVESSPTVAPTPFVPSVDCVATFAPDLGLPQFLPTLLEQLGILAGQVTGGQMRTILNRYRESSMVLGREVRVWGPAVDRPESSETTEPLVVGTVASLDQDLALRIRGVAEPVRNGRLALEETCREFGL